ncbi:hypothetical protein RM704_08795 [Streptomyces sp. DSM 3412]|uniref:Uncharacterized protein n=1 Tax=Streptomyces gottesmaniae TaxID=3075518 RepID=A0ABU2YTB8_9ACTN|nr:hypothetical protein [Streptomyces sp. DSM 3412]MDT0567564.1 hypothetical protein [Streptomyces sp. DSM 3412]
MTHHDKRNPDDKHDKHHGHDRHGRHTGEDKPDTALDEVLHEAERAETDVTDSERRRRHHGEAGDAITPNERAQEESHHD